MERSDLYKVLRDTQTVISVGVLLKNVMRKINFINERDEFHILTKYTKRILRVVQRFPLCASKSGSVILVTYNSWFFPRDYLFVSSF